jgi:ribulose 1,5-bisphosphate synthetase/thiazole synthase
MLNSGIKFVLTAALAATGVVALDERALLNQTYDYIIVGGGTAGLTLANRLTENANRI